MVDASYVIWEYTLLWIESVSNLKYKNVILDTSQIEVSIFELFAQQFNQLLDCFISRWLQILTNVLRVPTFSVGFHIIDLFPDFSSEPGTWIQQQNYMNLINARYRGDIVRKRNFIELLKSVQVTAILDLK